MKSVKVEVDDAVEKVCSLFDYPFSGVSEFTPPEIPEVAYGFSIGLIVGPSGSGKSTILEDFGEEEQINWQKEKAIISQFEETDDAIERLSAVGLNSIPSWVRPYHVLSTGEKFRADLSRRLKDGAVVDEFTSVVDRNVAKAASYAVRRFVDKQGMKGLVFASCHYDIADWLRPDWVYDTATEKYSVGRLERPSINIELLPCGRQSWSIFCKHHYLDSKLNNSSRCWLAIWNGVPVGFASVLAFPSGNWKNGWRGHRTVILPDYQGLGIGVRVSDAVGKIMVTEGARYFSKTAHPRMGEYRQSSPLWRPTSKNKMVRKDYLSGRQSTYDGDRLKHAGRFTYSHEYIGAPEHK